MSMLLTAVTEVKAAERAGQDLGLGTFATQFIARGTILMAHNPPFLVGFNWYRHSKGRQVRAVDQDDQRKTIGAYDIDNEFFFLNFADAFEDRRCSGGRLVDRHYLNPNCAFSHNATGKTLVLVTLKAIANGEQVLAQCYMKKV
jgi:hypothetical protein